MKRNLGITLIALVITIVVLIILASVAITLSLGDNGVFRKAAKAKEDTKVAQNEERVELSKATNQIDETVLGSNRNIVEEREELLQNTQVVQGKTYNILDISKYKYIEVFLYAYSNGNSNLMTSRKINVLDIEIGNNNQFIISESQGAYALYMQYGFVNKTTFASPYTGIRGWTDTLYTKIVGYK